MMFLSVKRLVCRLYKKTNQQGKQSQQHNRKLEWITNQTDIRVKKKKQPNKCTECSPLILN